MEKHSACTEISLLKAELGDSVSQSENGALVALLVWKTNTWSFRVLEGAAANYSVQTPK